MNNTITINGQHTPVDVAVVADHSWLALEGAKKLQIEWAALSFLTVQVQRLMNPEILNHAFV